MGNTAVHIATRKSRPQAFPRSTTMGSSSTSKTTVDLPSDLLLPILSRLDLKDRQSLSLVSKPFLKLSNRFVRKLSFKTLPDDRSFTQIFTRFTSVSQINLRTKGVGVARALTAISKSQLNLEVLKIRDWPTYPEQITLSGKLNIKSLGLGYFPEVKVDEVVEFIRLFPSLEELYFGRCYVWDDAGVESLAAMLPNLLKIDLSNNYYLTDRALYALSANCTNLELICIDGCNKFTPQGLCTFLLRCRKLRYLDLPYFTKFPESNMLVAETVSACENVHHLSINFSLITDDTLGIIAKSRAPLTSLKMRSFNLRPTIAYTMSGLSAILCAFKGLTRLAIYLPLPESDKFLDKKMSKLVKSLPCLSGISITSYCPIYATLFSLIENCPFMESIYLNMDLSYPDRCLRVPMPRLINKNYTIKYIRLYPSPDALFNIALASFCPCLKIWDGNFPKKFF
ncbi:unnamed protein product [Rhodiola kirilowii]